MRFYHLPFVLIAIFIITTGQNASAGKLLIKNTSANPITCTVDGYTTATGANADTPFQIVAGRTAEITPSYGRPTPVINWAACGNLKMRALAVTPSGSDVILILNGLQTRTLDAALYPFLPSNPTGNFAALKEHVVNTYQAKYPEVALALVMDQTLPIYSYKQLAIMLGSRGYDVMEIDALYLGFLVRNNLITPAKITGSWPLPVAIQASSINNVLYGVPSWLCTDFIFSRSSNLGAVKSLDALVAFLNVPPIVEPKLIGSYNGSWRVPAIWLNASWQAKPTGSILDNLVKLTGTCDNQNINRCINGVYHGLADGGTEEIFAFGNAGAAIGFSEQSFYIKEFGGAAKPITAIPATWGNSGGPSLLYNDTFVTNSSTCATNPCATDSANFSAMMTSLAMKNYIVFSSDLPTGNPWRRLLVATAEFWQQSAIVNDPLYSQFAKVFLNAQPFSNILTEAQRDELSSKACKLLKSRMPQFECNVDPPQLRREYRR